MSDKIPTVTEICSKYYNRQLESWAEGAVEYGTAVHDTIHEFIVSGEIPDNISFKRLALDQYIEWTEKFGLLPVLSEESLDLRDPITGDLLCSGRCDQLQVSNGRYVLFDIKTSSTLTENEIDFATLQLSIYRLAVEQRFPAIKVENARLLWLPKKSPGKIEKITLLPREETWKIVKSKNYNNDEEGGNHAN